MPDEITEFENQTTGQPFVPDPPLPPDPDDMEPFYTPTTDRHDALMTQVAMTPVVPFRAVRHISARYPRVDIDPTTHEQMGRHPATALYLCQLIASDEWLQRINLEHDHLLVFTSIEGLAEGFRHSALVEADIDWDQWRFYRVIEPTVQAAVPEPAPPAPEVDHTVTSLNVLHDDYIRNSQWFIRGDADEDTPHTIWISTIGFERTQNRNEARIFTQAEVVEQLHGEGDDCGWVFELLQGSPNITRPAAPAVAAEPAIEFVAPPAPSDQPYGHPPALLEGGYSIVVQRYLLGHQDMWLLQGGNTWATETTAFGINQTSDRNLARAYPTKKLIGTWGGNESRDCDGWRFELLPPAGPPPTPPEAEREITHAESQRMEGSERFRVKFNTPASPGREYAGINSIATNIHSACLFTRSELNTAFGEYPKKDIAIELMKPCRISRLQVFFNSSVIEMLKTVPQNDQVRAFMMSRLKVMPPKDCDTFDKVRDWVEFNCCQPRRVTKWPVAGAVPAARVVPVSDVLKLAVKANRKTRGKCDWSKEEEAHDTWSFRVEDIEGCADGAETLDDLIRVLNGLLYDNWEPEYGSVAGYQHDDHETDDDETETSISINVPMGETKRQLVNYLRCHRPELLTKFGL